MIPLPQFIAERISRRAVEIAQMTGPRKTGNALASLMPDWSTGKIGIEVPFTASYILNIDSGTDAREMHELAGRTLPIRQSDGSVQFRTVRKASVGKTPIITRSADDGRIINDKPMWVYPRSIGSNFLEKSLDRSLEEWVSTSSQEEFLDMLWQTNLKDTLDSIFYGKPS